MKTLRLKRLHSGEAHTDDQEVTRVGKGDSERQNWVPRELPFSRSFSKCQAVKVYVLQLRKGERDV